MANNNTLTNITTPNQSAFYTNYEAIVTSYAHIEAEFNASLAIEYNHKVVEVETGSSMLDFLTSLIEPLE